MTRQSDKIVATFCPRRTDDLLPEAIPLIGRSFTWHAAWPIEDGPYAGQWAWTSRDAVDIGWVPTEDLGPAQDSADVLLSGGLALAASDPRCSDTARVYRAR